MSDIDKPKKKRPRLKMIQPLIKPLPDRLKTISAAKVKPRQSDEDIKPGLDDHSDPSDTL